MRIALAHNLRREHTEASAELYTREEVELLREQLSRTGHDAVPVEVSGPPGDIVDAIIAARPELIFNVAEGTAAQGIAREAYYPAIYERLRIPYTGSRAGLLTVDLDKRLTEKLLAVYGVRAPRGLVLTREQARLPDDLPYPVFVKPNYEGSSKGITQQSVVGDRREAERLVTDLLDKYPEGVTVEQFVPGRELTVPMLEAWPGHLLEIVEARAADSEHNVLDYEAKQQPGAIEIICPPELSARERQDVLAMADRVLQVLPCADLGRVDIRLHEDGTPYFIEVNALPRLQPNGSLVIGARAKGIEMEEVLELVVRSAARRYGLPLTPRPTPLARERERVSAREAGVRIGYYSPGDNNAITDVEGVLVGHVTHVTDDMPDPDDPSATTCVRTGITAVVPRSADLFNNHLVAGGFVLNGIGEMSGLIQAMEWGWLETPILLTNTMSLGRVHSGIIQYMVGRHPELGRKVDVIIPLVAETNDAFLNDVRHPANTAADAIRAIESASAGPVPQGSVGGGTGMITFDFAGGIGSSSRVLPPEEGGYTVGVLVQSNFGQMRNLTIGGAVVGRELDPMYPRDTRRGRSYGSVIVVVATDAPLLSPQLSRLAKRAALGLGRVGSFAASTSGEIVFAFSTGNRTSREAKERARWIELSFVTDERINPLYQAVIEATEEAVLNAIFHSAGMKGREGHYAPALPVPEVMEILGRLGSTPAGAAAHHAERGRS